MNNKSTNFHGVFILRNDGDGCFSAKYLNTEQITPFVAACKQIVPDTTDPFMGVFTTVWLDQSDQHVRAKLVITKRFSDTYDLNWHDYDNFNLLFTGIGMLYNGLLVASYK
jgi:hypothetical protein